jgi:hydantoinase/carbamoylase family amidase
VSGIHGLDEFSREEARVSDGADRIASFIRVERAVEDLETLGKISEAGEGVTRLGYSPEEVRARAWLRERLEEAGLVAEQDAAGNVFGWLPRWPPTGGGVLVTGSHLDSVPHGGRLDGALGVVAGIEVLRAWKESGVATRGPLGMVAFACEESSRFGIGCIGSRWVVGSLNVEHAHQLRDAGGISLWDAMAQSGCNVGEILTARREGGWLRGFVEMHIDQGLGLVEAQAAVAVVTSIVGPTKLRGEFHGETGHAGTLPASRRRDAAVAAAHLIIALAALGRKHEANEVFLTAGALELWPGSINTVPGRSRVWIDLRCPEPELQEEILAELGRLIAAAAEAAGVTGRLEIGDLGMPKLTDRRVVETLAAVAKERGIPCPRVVSRAGHDARHLSSIGPVGMLFVRNRSGVSHRPEEAVSVDDLSVALGVLGEGLLRLDLLL